MKLKLIVLAGAFFALPGLTSCKKDSVADSDGSNDQNNNIVQPGADSNYLYKIYLIDSTAAGQDTTQVENYIFDNQKRVIEIVDSSLGLNPGLFAKKVFLYSGADSLPFKSTLYVFDANNSDTVTSYFYFDNIGRLLKDSVIDITSNTSPYIQIRQKVLNISYSSGMMYGYTIDSVLSINNLPSAGAAEIVTDTVTLDLNQNMVQTIQHRNSNRYLSTNTFDNSAHPFRRLNIFMCWGDEIFRSGYLDPSQPNSNNISSVVESATGAQSYTRSFAVLNSYYSNGLIKTVAHPISAGSPDYQKYVFLYKSF